MSESLVTLARSVAPCFAPSSVQWQMWGRQLVRWPQLHRTCTVFRKERHSKYHEFRDSTLKVFSVEIRNLTKACQGARRSQRQAARAASPVPSTVLLHSFFKLQFVRTTFQTFGWHHHQPVFATRQPRCNPLSHSTVHSREQGHMFIE